DRVFGDPLLDLIMTKLSPCSIRWSSALLLSGMMLGEVHAQVTLGTSPYFEAFDGTVAGLPTGWTVRTGATATALGTAQTLNTGTTAWANATGQFNSYSSLDAPPAASG